MYKIKRIKNKFYLVSFMVWKSLKLSQPLKINLKNHLPKVNFLVILILLFLLYRRAWPQESYTELGSVLRPKVEYTAQNARDPFEDYITEIVITDNQPIDIQIQLPSFVVQGLIWGGNVPCAIINNKVVRQGDTIDGAKIIKIKKEGIEILYQEKKFTIPSYFSNPN